MNGPDDAAARGGDDARTLGADDVPDVVDVLCDAFEDYPVMRYVLDSPDEPDERYRRRLRTLIHFFVMARVLRDEALLGIDAGGGLGAAATISYSWTPGSPAELGELRESVWAELGPAARARYEEFGAAASAFSVDSPHMHLNMIGVRSSLQGSGLGGRLLDAVHRFSREDRRSEGVSLDTNTRNVPLYERFGYEVIGRARIGPELEIWGLYRPTHPSPTTTRDTVPPAERT